MGVTTNQPSLIINPAFSPSLQYFFISTLMNPLVNWQAKNPNKQSLAKSS